MPPQMDDNLLYSRNHLRNIIHLVLVSLLVASLNACKENVPPHELAIRGNTKALEKLIDAGLDINTRDQEGGTLLFNASAYGQIHTVSMLLAHKADTEIPAALNKLTPIAVAAVQGDENVVRTLLKFGAKPVYKDSTGKIRSALAYAAATGRTSVVQLLLNHGAQPDQATDVDGNTELMIAAARGYQAIVELLIKYGADPRRVNNSGESAYDRAARGGFFDIADKIKDAGSIKSKQVGRVDGEGWSRHISPKPTAAMADAS